MSDGAIVIGLSAVVVAVRDGQPVVLTVRPSAEPGLPAGLPFGPFDPVGDRTFELALRAFVTAQTRFDLGYVEQLYTFGDKGRDAPLADLGLPQGAGAPRVISVGYLGLTPQAVDTHAPDSAWADCRRFFPYEDWRDGSTRPASPRRPPATAASFGPRPWSCWPARSASPCCPTTAASWPPASRACAAS
jgi:hypothetical protein